jgi:hypothetical protein
MLIAIVNDNNYFLKYCEYCNIVKDLRVHHCRHCNLCVIRHGNSCFYNIKIYIIILDHHCPWLSTCIGAKNHHSFLFYSIYSFVICMFYMILTIIFLVHDIKNIGHNNEECIDPNNNEYFCNTYKVYNFIFVLFTWIFTMFLACLVFFQVKFISSNVTTSEYLSKTNVNTFDKGFKNNWKQFMNDIYKYKESITYNEMGKYYINSNVLLQDYFINLSKKSFLKSSKKSAITINDDKSNTISKELNMSIISNESKATDSYFGSHPGTDKSIIV